MKAKTAESKVSIKIQHPLAKYNSLGQVVCTVCNVAVKSETLWTVHLLNKSHKVNVENSQSNGKPEMKRKTDLLDAHIPTKKLKGDSSFSTTRGIPTDVFDPSAKPLKSCLKTSRLAEYSSSDNDDEIETETIPSSSSLPSDFFDSKPTTSTQEDKPPDKAAPAVISDALPEGFFDDPIMDAKVRQVEYRDKMEDEWESFQKAVKQQTQVSEAIEEDEEEQTTLDRNILEIDEQMQSWKEINDLQERRENLLQNKAEKMDESSEVLNDSDDDTEELDEILDWRSKNAWR